MFDFLNITIADILDILLVAVLIYEIYRLIRGTTAINIFIGIVLLYVVWAVVEALNMTLLSTIMEQVLGVGLIALIVIFQPEIRRFLIRMGSEIFSARKRGSGKIRSFFRKYKENSSMDSAALDEITLACSQMSQTKTGALIVLQHVSALNSFIETGDTINGTISCRLLESIFFKNSPLHDGAVILSSDRVIAARCTLPISDSQDIPPRYGMRHRAAVGITEATDAHAIVVSEETGEISYVTDGVIKTMGSITELRLAIEKSFEV